MFRPKIVYEEKPILVYTLPPDTDDDKTVIGNGALSRDERLVKMLSDTLGNKVIVGRQYGGIRFPWSTRKEGEEVDIKEVLYILDEAGYDAYATCLEVYRGTVKGRKVFGIGLKYGKENVAGIEIAQTHEN